MRECPDEAFLYGTGDTQLDPLMLKRCEQLNRIIGNALGIPAMFNPALHTHNSLPRSSGSLVAKTFENWLIAKQPELYRGVLMLTDTGNDKLWDGLNAIRDSLAEGQDLQAVNAKLRNPKQ